MISITIREYLNNSTYVGLRVYAVDSKELSLSHGLKRELQYAIEKSRFSWTTAELDLFNELDFLTHKKLGPILLRVYGVQYYEVLYSCPKYEFCIQVSANDISYSDDTGTDERVQG